MYSVLVAFFGFILIASTAYDVYVQYLDLATSKLFITFSEYTNCAQLFEIKENSEAISFLNGLRSLSVCWIIFGHRFTSSFFPHNEL